MAYYTLSLAELIEARNERVVFADDSDTGHTYIEGRDASGSFARVLDTYQLFNEDYRERLNGLIIDRFYNREIGQETGDMFRLAFRRHLNENMPYWNKLYAANLIEVDPLSTIDMKTVTSARADQTGSANTKVDTKSSVGGAARSVYSDLPNKMLAGNEDYASNATDSNSQTETAGGSVDESASSTETESDSDSRTSGYQGHAVELLQAYRDTLWNVDTMFLESLDPLFMGVWLSGDTQTLNNPHLYGRTYDAF